MVNLVNARKEVVFGKDSIIIQKFIAGIKGGRNLNVEGFEGVLYAGHVIITKDGEYKPMPVSGEAYASLPEGWKMVGVLYRSISVDLPMAAIMTIGQVNSAALKYEVPSGFAAACPHIELIKDEASV